MAFDVVMFGTLTVPERNLEEWLTTPTDAEVFPWLESLGGADVTLDTPEALLAFLGDLQLAPHEFLEVTQVEGQLTLRAYLGEDAWRECAQVVGLLFASAGAFGGHGAATMTGYQGIRFGEVVKVEKGEVRHASLTTEGLWAVERSPAYQAVDERIHQRFDGLVGRPGAPLDARNARWAVHPFTGRKVKVAADA